MTLPKLEGRRRRLSKGLTLALSLAGFSCLFPSTGLSQVAEVLEQRREDFREAQSAYEAARAAQQAREGRFQRALVAIDSVNLAGNRDQVDQAYATAQRLSVELQQQERRVEETAAVMEETRDLLVEALRAQIEEFLAVADTTSNLDEADALATILQDLINESEELQALEPEIEVAVMPEIAPGPRDGPEDLRRYASFLDYRGDQYESNLADIDIRLERLLERQGTNRRMADFLASIGRFDDTQVPVTVRRSRTDEQTDPDVAPSGADSVLAVRTIEQEIRDLEALREEVTDRLRRVRERADLFRRLAGGVWA